MNWEILGSVGEVLGAIAVLVSLIYLSTQIRNSNRLAEAATTLDASRLLAEWHRGIHQTSDLAQIMFIGMEDASKLSEADRARFSILIAEYYILVEALYHQHSFGLVKEDTWLSIERSIFQTQGIPFIRSWWLSKVSIASEEFRDYIEQNIDKFEVDYGERMNEPIRDSGDSDRDA